MDRQESVEASQAERWLASLVRAAAVVSGITLFLLMLLVAAEVVGRYFFNAPIYGAQDVLEIGMVIVVLLAMAYCAQTEGHIAVDVFESLMGPRALFWADMLTAVVSVVILSLIVVSAFYKAQDTYTYAEATNLLRIPLWYFYVLIAAGFLMHFAVVFVRLLSLCLGWRSAK